MYQFFLGRDWLTAGGGASASAASGTGAGTFAPAVAGSGAVDVAGLTVAGGAVFVTLHTATGAAVCIAFASASLVPAIPHGTFTLEFLGQGAPSGLAATASGSAIYWVPSGVTYTGSGIARTESWICVIIASSRSTFTPPPGTWGLVDLLPPTASGQATFLLQTGTATGNPLFPEVIASASLGQFVMPRLATGAATTSEAGGTGAAVYQAGPSATGSAPLAPPTMLGAALRQPPFYTGTGSLTLPLTVAGSGTRSLPNYQGTAAIPAPSPVMAGAGTRAMPVYQGTGAASIGTGIIGDGWFVVPVGAVSGSPEIPRPTMTGQGLRSPAVVGSGAVQPEPLLIGGVGVRSVPGYAAVGAAALLTPTVVGVGTRLPSTYTGTGVATPTRYTLVSLASIGGPQYLGLAMMGIVSPIEAFSLSYTTPPNYSGDGGVTTALVTGLGYNAEAGYYLADAGEGVVAAVISGGSYAWATITTPRFWGSSRDATVFPVRTTTPLPPPTTTGSLHYEPEKKYGYPSVNSGLVVLPTGAGGGTFTVADITSSGAADIAAVTAWGWAVFRTHKYDFGEDSFADIPVPTMTGAGTYTNSLVYTGDGFVLTRLIIAGGGAAPLNRAMFPPIEVAGDGVTANGRHQVYAGLATVALPVLTGEGLAGGPVHLGIGHASVTGCSSTGSGTRTVSFYEGGGAAVIEWVLGGGNLYGRVQRFRGEGMAILMDPPTATGAALGLRPQRTGSGAPLLRLAAALGRGTQESGLRLATGACILGEPMATASSATHVTYSNNGGGGGVTALPTASGRMASPRTHAGEGLAPIAFVRAGGAAWSWYNRFANPILLSPILVEGYGLCPQVVYSGGGSGLVTSAIAAASQRGPTRPIGSDDVPRDRSAEDSGTRSRALSRSRR